MQFNYRSFIVKSGFLALFAFINIFAYFKVSDAGINVGDVSGRLLSDNYSLLLGLFSVVLSYFFVVIFFYILPKLIISKFDPVLEMPFEKESKLDVFLLLLQVSYLFFNLYYGVRAGLNEEISNPIKYLWVFIPVDYLFYIYYAIRPRNKTFYCNFFVFAVANLSRGFAGFIMFIIFIEVWKRCVEHRLKILHVAIILAVIIFYPLLHAVKGAVRLSSEDVGFITTFLALLNDFNIASYVDLIGVSFEKLIYRLQIVSISSEVIFNANEVRALIHSGVVTPIWLEGIHGNIMAHLGIIDKTVNLGTYITTTSIFSSSREVGSWNTNYGLLTLFFVDKAFLLLSLIYLFSLSIIAFFVMQIFDVKSRGSLHSLYWFVLFIFLVPPWASSYFSFVYAIFIYVFLNWLAGARIYRRIILSARN